MLERNPRTLVFDMDGTIADLYSVKDWLPLLRSESAYPYSEADFMGDEKLPRILDFLRSYHGYKVIVCSWTSKGASVEYRKAIRRAKRDWLIRHDFPYDHLHVIPYGTKKHTICKKYGESILFDDNEAVRDAWDLGETVDPAEVDIYQFLLDILRGVS